MNNPAIQDCSGTALSFVESDRASQPEQSNFQTTSELLDRNDELTPLLKLFALYDREDVIEFRFLHLTKLVWFQGRSRNHSVSIYRRAGEILDKSHRVVKLLIQKQHGGYNCYFSIHPRYPVKGNRASSSPDVRTIRCFALDVDGVTPEQRDDFLREHKLQTPTLTVNSGYGLHFYWFLSVALSRYAGASLFSEFVERHSSQQQIKADPRCRDAARILRLPGTINQQKGTRPPALCEIIEADSTLRYHPADLLPERRLLIEESLRGENENYERQDQQWNEWVKSRKAPPTPAWSLPTQPAPKSPSIISIKKTPICHTSHRFGGEGRDINAEFVKALIENHPIEKAGTRHEVAQRLLIALKRTQGQLPEKILHCIHKKWFAKNQKAMSGNTSEEASFAEFVALWSWLWSTDDPSRTGDFFGQLKIVPHPARHLISKSKRYERHRRLADIMYTGSQNVGFAPDQFFIGVKDIQKVLGLKSIDSAWGVLQVLKRSELVVETIAGSQITGRAARYSIPDQWRVAGEGGFEALPVLQA